MHFYLRFLCMAFISLVLIGPSYPLFSLIVFFNHDDGLSSSLFIIFHLPFVFSYRFISLFCSPYYYDYIFFVFFFFLVFFIPLFYSRYHSLIFVCLFLLFPFFGLLPHLRLRQSLFLILFLNHYFRCSGFSFLFYNWLTFFFLRSQRLSRIYSP